MREAEVHVRPRALFVGLCTLDIIQLVDHVPAPNEKLTALKQAIAAGGPATNAAVTHAYLGGAATLLTGIGAHPLAAGITADLGERGITVVDLDEGRLEPPTVSSILVTARTGDRAVTSINGAGRELRAPADLGSLISTVRAVEFDGHHMHLAVEVARAAHAAKRLTVFDGGSWKSGTEELLRWIDVAVCSNDFSPPGLRNLAERLEFLLAHGVRWAAVSRGGNSILWATADDAGEVEVPKVEVVDTLGAGDVLHGALTYALARCAALDSRAFENALRQAGQLAARACGHFGTRWWMTRDSHHPHRA